MAGILIALGRILLALIFVSSGFMKIFTFAETRDMMYMEGMDYVTVLLIASIIVEIGAGLLVLIGWHARIGAFLLIVFLIPVTLIFHDFWMPQHSEPAAQQNQMAHFMKNVAIIGGLLCVMAYDFLRIRGIRAMTKA